MKEPDLFNAHIAIAAGDFLGMGYKEGERFIDLIANEVESSPGKRRYLYVTSADADSGDKSPEIRKNLEELDSVMAPLQGEKFKFISKIFSNEGHYDVALPAFLEALDLIFPKDDWSARYRDIVSKPGNAMKNIDDHYQKVTTRYGFSILPRAERWNSLNRLSWIGPYLLRQGRKSEGIEIIERWVEYRPKSTLALGALAEAYEANNQIDKALSTLNKAYKLSQELEMQNSEEYLRKLEALKIKIQGK